MCSRVCVCVCVHACICLCERERKREREEGKKKNLVMKCFCFLFMSKALGHRRIHVTASPVVLDSCPSVFSQKAKGFLGIKRELRTANHFTNASVVSIPAVHKSPEQHSTYNAHSESSGTDTC